MKHVKTNFTCLKKQTHEAHYGTVGQTEKKHGLTLICVVFHLFCTFSPGSVVLSKILTGYILLVTNGSLLPLVKVTHFTHKCGPF